MGVCAAVLMTGGCAPDIPTEVNDLPDVVGEWEYVASDVRIAGAPGGICSITNLTLLIGPWRSSGFYGRSEGGELSCSGTLSQLSGDLDEYPIRRGGAVAEFIAFDIGTPDWRHEGTLAADTMSGIFRLYHTGLQLNGRFRAVRKSASVDPALLNRMLSEEK